jgi:hypothetical protein
MGQTRLFCAATKELDRVGDVSVHARAGDGHIAQLPRSSAEEVYGLRHKPFWHNSPGMHCELSVQDFGQGPTALTGADVNSVREPIAQNISTG